MPKGEIRDLLSPAMLKEARRLAGIDQGELARLVGLSRKTIVVVERELSTKVDPRRRAVLERIRSLFEKRFHLQFDTDKQTVIITKSGRRTKSDGSPSTST
ncbi:helix-turn-helix domain-containing protein [Bradyrhizobium vignae]|uniref:HTH cro/C1-type domain-containing protein n=1 Tax=Bradyrhizobium vignae TaxID=1549949 RepID=A0A2U3PUN6_9BRAD|nr:helix-turn-helix domain-containing protein [Bradyrhizobium vignae]SPP92863.1 protein of unknown function [Bradyrhizobium vignae]